MSNSFSYIFFGTPDYAARYLEALIQDGRVPRLVVTQPDRPVGRKKTLSPSPVKILAQKNGIEVLQPENINEQRWLDALSRIQPDIIVVVAFGQILSQKLLSIPRLGCINVHPSLLPRHRGASPLQETVLQGDKQTGVSIIQMDEKMDHGPIIAQKTVLVDSRETLDSLREKTVAVGTQLLVATMQRTAEGILPSRPQDHAAATFTRLFSRDDGKISWEQNCESIDRQIRALNPWPGTWTTIAEKRLKILRAHPAHSTPQNTRKPGSFFLDSESHELLVSCGDGALALDEIQLDGSTPMSGSNFARGNARLLGIAQC